MLNKKRFLNSITLFSMIVLALSGCSTPDYGRSESYGRLESDREIKRSFESYQVLPNHKYYFRDVASSPIAIVGVENTYELILKMWTPIDTDSDDFRKMIDIISLNSEGNTSEPWGFRILDHKGNYVGVWYSALQATAVGINDKRQIVYFGPSIVVRGPDHK